MNFFRSEKQPQEIMLLLALRVKNIRKNKGISQFELAQRSGVSLGSIKRFEQSGKISMESFLMLLHILGRLEEMDSILMEGENLAEIEKLFD